LLFKRLPPARECLGSDADEAALAPYREAIRRAQSVDRQVIRATASAECAPRPPVDFIPSALDMARTWRPIFSWFRGTEAARPG
ncbi:MAG TPA: hypothetical protein VKE74_05730, partial [Gemmataceae bacterium]|nr:hypothetical protein [Gemmataceae bacterium]